MAKSNAQRQADFRARQRSASARADALEDENRRLRTMLGVEALLTKAEATKITLALHPDNSASDTTRHEAFIAFNRIKAAITRY